MGCGAAREVDALEADELAHGRLVAARLREVKLGDFVAGEVAAVPDVGFYGDIIADVDGGRNVQAAIGEVGVAEAVAEGIERLAGEVAVGAVLHRVVLKGRKL